MDGKILNFASLECIKNGNNANIFNLEFGHENFTLTNPLLKEVPPFVLSPLLFKNFFPAPPFVSQPKFSSPPLKKGEEREL